MGSRQHRRAIFWLRPLLHLSYVLKFLAHLASPPDCCSCPATSTLHPSPLHTLLSYTEGFSGYLLILQAQIPPHLVNQSQPQSRSLWLYPSHWFVLFPFLQPFKTINFALRHTFWLSHLTLSIVPVSPERKCPLCQWKSCGTSKPQLLSWSCPNHSSLELALLSLDSCAMLHSS